MLSEPEIAYDSETLDRLFTLNTYTRGDSVLRGVLEPDNDRGQRTPPSFPL